MGLRELNRVRKIALGLPEVNERLSHGTICFFVRDKRPLCYFHDVDFHREGSRVSLWCPAPPGVPADLVAAEPERFFRPTPSADGTFSDWLGVYLDKSGENTVDWGEVAAIIEDAYRTVAYKKLIIELNNR